MLGRRSPISQGIDSDSHRDCVDPLFWLPSVHRVYPFRRFLISIKRSPLPNLLNDDLQEQATPSIFYFHISALAQHLG